MAKQTKITIEIDSLLVVRGGNPVRAWCPRCAAEAEMILQSVEGSTLLCLNSLLALVQNTKPQRGEDK